MAKFKIDPSKKAAYRNFSAKFAIDPGLHRWVKAIAAFNDVDVSSALNQAVEFAKKNSERISL